MTKLKIYEYPHPILKKKAERVEKVNDEIRKLIDDMLETMYDGGVGLAAPQIGVSKRIVVIDAEQNERGQRGNPISLINPEIIWKSEEKVLFCEGCLSIPEQNADVERFESVRVRYLDYNGEEKEILAEDYLAIIMQHELDHLDGVLYIDRISRIKRSMLLKKLEKMRKEEKEEQ